MRSPKFCAIFIASKPKKFRYKVNKREKELANNHSLESIWFRGGDNYDDLTLESEALALFKRSEDEIKREVDRRYALAVAQHEVTGWVERLVKILKS